jgi:hypothetical protein
MAAQANIVLNDGATTPVAHTFNPKGTSVNPQTRKSQATWRDQAVGPALNYLSLKEEHSPVNANGMQKFRYVIDVPTLEQAASGGSFVPPPTKAYSTVAVIEVWAHDRASDQELKNIVAYAKNFAASTYFSDAVVKREPAW